MTRKLYVALCDGLLRGVVVGMMLVTAAMQAR
jgi:hypothetical protein